MTQLLAWLDPLDPAALTPIDAAMYLRDVVVASLPGSWSWQLAGYRPASLHVADGRGIELVARARVPGGVDIAVSPTAVAGG